MSSKREGLYVALVALGTLFFMLYLLIPFVLGMSNSSFELYKRKNCAPITNYEKYFVMHKIGCDLGVWLEKPIKKQ